MGGHFCVFEIKNQKCSKTCFFPIFSGFWPQKGPLESNFQKKYFVITKYRLKVLEEKIMHFRNFFRKSLNNRNFDTYTQTHNHLKFFGHLQVNFEPLLAKTFNYCPYWGLFSIAGASTM